MKRYLISVLREKIYRVNAYKGIFHINIYLEVELCNDTYEFKKYKNMKLVNQLSYWITNHLSG